MKRSALLLAALLAPLGTTALDERASAPAAPSVSAGAAVPSKPAERKPTTVYVTLQVPANRAKLFAACEGERGAGTVRIPIFSARASQCPVATVATEIISVEDLAEALRAEHAARAPETGSKRDMDFAPALQRLVNIRLFALEAHEIGLDKLPAYQDEVTRIELATLIRILQQRVIHDVKPAPALVEQLYKEAVRQYKLRSVFFEKEEDAKAFAAQLKAGKTFDALAKQAVADKKARGGGAGDWTPEQGMLPEVHQAVLKLKPGTPSESIRVPNGFAFVVVDGTRYPEVADARVAARNEAVTRTRRVALERYFEKLKKKYATLDVKLLRSIDYEASKPGIKALRKDARPIAVIRGEKPITVADLSDGISKKFFHGLEQPAKEKRINVQIVPVFEAMLRSRLFVLEARAQRLQDSDEYRAGVADEKRGLAFGAMMERVIMPSVKLSEEQGKAYYEQHKSEFAFPGFYKLDAMTFASAKDAQSALDKLRSGTDFKWLRANMPGQVKDDDRVLQLDGGTLSSTAMPKELTTALTNAKRGDFRLYAQGGQHFVIRVTDVTTPTLEPYAAARESIARTLSAREVAKAVADYADRLRKAVPVETFITRIGS